MAAEVMTLQEAAAALGVHYMTAYRYVRLGLLPAVKVGGSWQVSTSDLDGFRDGAVTGPHPGRGRGHRVAPWSERLEARLVAGDARGAWGVVEAALAAGTDLAGIYLDVLTPAMRSIGTRWEAGELDIAVEHRATGIAMRLLGRLGPRFTGPGRTRGTVVLGAPEGERHALPVAMLADLVRQEGWEVSDLGADVPRASFVHAVSLVADVAAVGVSITTEQALEPARATLAALARSAPDVLLVVGGAAVHDGAHAAELGAHAVARDAAAFVRLLESTGEPRRRRRTRSPG